jgi:hypothetical protein
MPSSKNLIEITHYLIGCKSPSRFCMNIVALQLRYHSFWKLSFHHNMTAYQNTRVLEAVLQAHLDCHVRTGKRNV